MSPPRSTEPLWLAPGRAPAADRPAISADVEVDVAVVGAGIAGITTALLLQRDGARVAVLDRGAVAGGATGATTAKVSALQQTRYSQIRRVHDDRTAAAYAAAQLEAIAWMDALIAAEGIDCAWERLPAFTCAGDADQVPTVEREAAAARAAGLDVTVTDETPLPFAALAAVRLDDQAQFDPVRYVRGLAGLLERDGGLIFERSAVTGVHEGTPCRVETERGPTVTARDVVIATNYPLLDRGLFFARMEATRSYLVAARVRGEAPRGMLITAGQPTRSVRPYVDGDDTWVLVGGEGHLTGAEKAAPERFEALEAFAREHFDVVDVPYRWATQDGMPTDELPYAGRYTPVSKHLFVNAGGQKWGMTNATAGAFVIADRLAGRDRPYGRVVDPNRVSVKAAPKVAKAQAWVAAHFVGDRLRPGEASSADEVPAGEARVVRSGLGRTGVYRDEAGNLHALSMRCPHLGCLVRFNDAERTWDCPCHGSRFDIDGAVLAGPAVSPLERREPPGAS